jgi:hypothetical protein
LADLAPVYVLATLDTKFDEANFLAEAIRAESIPGIIIDQQPVRQDAALFVRDHGWRHRLRADRESGVRPHRNLRRRGVRTMF